MNRITSVIEALDITRADLARVCGVTPQAVHAWEERDRIPVAHHPRIRAALAERIARIRFTPEAEEALAAQIEAALDTVCPTCGATA